jgi:hypothetical protein
MTMKKRWHDWSFLVGVATMAISLTAFLYVSRE